MPRWKNRSSTFFDLFVLFEATSSNKHIHDALSAIQSLKDDGIRYLGDSSDPYDHWKRGCDELFDFISKDMARKEVKDSSQKIDENTELLTIFRKFINEFEHSEMRLHQILYSSSIGKNRNQFISNTWDGLNIIYQFSIYAIISIYLGDTTKQVTVKGRVKSTIQSLKNDGVRYLGGNSGPCERWERGCDELFDFVNKLQSGKDMKRKEAKDSSQKIDGNTELLTIFKEFIDKFEHFQKQLHQILCSRSIDENRDQAISNTRDWLNIIYRFSTYAIISTYLGDRTEHTIIRIRISLSTGKSYTETTHYPITILKKYRKKKK